MRLLIKDRGKGKTTGLIYASEATGFPIATGNEVMVEHIKQMAKKNELQHTRTNYILRIERKRIGCYI